MSSITNIIVNNAADFLSLVWMELTCAIFAVVAYVICSRRRDEFTPNLKLPSKVAAGNTCKATQGSDQEPTVTQLATKSLRQGNIKEAIDVVKQLPRTQTGRIPANLAFRLLSSIAKLPRIDDAILELVALKGKFPSGPLEAATAEALKMGNVSACRNLHRLANVLSIPKSQQTLQTLASAYSSDIGAMRSLVKEAQMPVSRHFAEIVLGASAQLKEPSLAAEVLEKVTSTDAATLKCKASLASPSSSTIAPSSMSDSNSTSPRNSSDEEAPKRNSSYGEAPSPKDGGDVGKERRPGVAREVGMRANDIRSCGRNRDLDGALKVFERLNQETADNTLVMNSVVDACVACKDLRKAVHYFERAKSRKVADTVTYNTMIKGYLASGNENAARGLLDDLSQQGLTATRPSFHGLLNARVNAGDARGAWRLVAEMQLADISPNAVTCSILLKCKPQSAVEVSKVLVLIDAMEEPMDEVLFLAVVEACIRTKNLEKLSKQIGKFMRGNSAGLTAPTYGSMIKAFGNAHDMNQVWSLWKQMHENKVLPTAVTLGCMVEALVTNGFTSEAWKLTGEMWNGEGTRQLVNTVIYSSILRGFANAGEAEKMMSAYQEMKGREIKPNRITYNTVINAFAQNGQMHRVTTVLYDMKESVPPVNPDIVTYSTIVKGFCNAGELDRALAVLNDMKAEGKCNPDEVMYNSLLGGCAKAFRCDDALHLLKDMKETGVAPSNYTLSMLVKLMGRCRRITEAFGILEDISKEHGLKINIQVYTCLIQGCFNCGQTAKALEVHDTIMKEGLCPDTMTYSVLVRGCLQAGLTEEAAELARCAYGFGSFKFRQGTAPGLSPGCSDEVVTALARVDEQRAKELAEELKGSRKVASSLSSR